MNYTLLTIDNKEYKLKLTTRCLINLEKKFKTNPINIILKLSDGESLPEIEPLLLILHEALQPLNHGISIDDVYDLYDKYLEEGKGLPDLLNLILNVFIDSGIIPKPEETKN